LITHHRPTRYRPTWTVVVGPISVSHGGSGGQTSPHYTVRSPICNVSRHVGTLEAVRNALFVILALTRLGQ